MPPATHRITLLSATSLASAVAVVGVQPADAAVVYTVQVRNPDETTQSTANVSTVLSVTDVLGNTVALPATDPAYTLVGTTASRSVSFARRSSSQTGTTNLTVTAPATAGSATYTATFNNALSNGSVNLNSSTSRSLIVGVTPTERSSGATIAGTFSVTGTNNKNNSDSGWSYSANTADKTNFTFQTIAVSAVASQTASTTIYALPGKAATQAFTVKNIGDGTKAGADKSDFKSELWGATTVTNGSSWAGSALTFDGTGTNLTDTNTSTDSLSTTFTYTGAATRGNSDTATIAATYTSGGTKNAGSTATTVLTGTTVAPVNSTTAGGNTLYALPGQKASGTVTITNVGDGSYAGASLTGTLTTSVTTGFAASVANGNFNLADGKAPSTPAATTLTQTMTYTGQSTRGASVAATVTANFTNGHTDGTNSGQTVTKVFTGQTVAPVQSVTTGGPNVYALPGQTVTRDFTIANTGDGSLAGATLNGTTSNTLGGGFASVTATGSFALNDGVTGPAASTLTHTVSYVGQSTRGNSSTATVTAAFSNGNSAGTNATQTVTQTFKAQVVAPVASTTSLATLGPVRVGTSTTGSVTVKNVGDGNLAGADNGTTLLTNLRGNVSVSGSSAITGGGAVNLTDASSQTYMFTYAPTARGSQSATITTAFTNGSADGKNVASTASSTVTGTAVGPDFDAVVGGKNASSGAIINGGTILFGEAVGGLTLQDLLISNLSNDAASKALTDLTLTNVTITGSTEFSFSLSGFDSGNTGSFGTSTQNAVLSNLYNGDGSGAIAIQFVSKAGTGAAQLRIETDEGAALGGAGAIYVYNLIWNVPEPGTIAVFGAGLLGLAISRQRRRGRAFVALTAKPEEEAPTSAR